MIGLTLSGCIADIVKGNVKADDVQKIIARTRISNDSQLEEVLSTYKEISWTKFPKEAEDLARKFWEEGKIEQPLLTGGTYYIANYNSQWMDSQGRRLIGSKGVFAVDTEGELEDMKRLVE